MSGRALLNINWIELIWPANKTLALFIYVSTHYVKTVYKGCMINSQTLLIVKAIDNEHV